MIEDAFFCDIYRETYQMEYNIILKDGNENTLRPQTTLQQVNGLTEALSNKGSNPDRTANSESKQIGYKVLDSRTTFQNQVTSENTIYEIRDVFDLDNSSTISRANNLRFLTKVI